MKNIVKIAVIGALIALGLARSNAGTLLTTNYTTNIVVKSKAIIVATVWLEGTNRVGFTTKTVLPRIASALGITLAPKASLELVHIISSTDNSGVTSLQGQWRVRLINGATTYDLSAASGVITNDANIFNVTAPDSIAVSKTSGNTTNTRRILHVSLDANGLSLEADGFSWLISKTSAKGTSEVFDCDFTGDGFDSNLEMNAVYDDGHFDSSGQENATEIIATITGGGA